MKTTKIKPHKSSLGMDANVASLVIFAAMIALSWVPYIGWFAWIVPLFFFFREKNSKFVKFQAVNALIIGAVRAALVVVLQIFVWILTPKDLVGALNFAAGGGWGAIALLGTISVIISLLITILTVYLIIMAYNYKQVELPVIGPIAKQISDKLNDINMEQTEDKEDKKPEDDSKSDDQKPEEK